MNKLAAFLIRLASLISIVMPFLPMTGALFFNAFSAGKILDNISYSCGTELG